MSYERAKKSWTQGLLTLEGLRMYYRAGIITKAQYQEIKALPQAGRGA